MKMRIWSDLSTRETRFDGSFTEDEVLATKLAPYEKALLQDVDRPKLRGSDYLLALEMLYRRHEEQHPETAGMAPFPKD